jgi:electron transfer flavoprotein alpha subunit
MKLLVGVKRVVDHSVNIRVRPDGRGVESDNVRMSMNPFDEIAVEQAVRLAESGKATEVVVVSIGPATAQDVLRTGLAMGASRAIHIRTDARIEPLSVAKLLAALVALEQPDCILLGKQAIDDDSNQVGQMLAGLLDWPQATFVSALDLHEDRLTATMETDGGTATIELTMPAVVTTDLRLNTPRYLSLPNMLKAKKKPIEETTPETLGVGIAPRHTIIKVEAPVLAKQLVELHSVDELTALLKPQIELGGAVHVLVAGFQVNEVAAATALIEGVDKVLVADALDLADGLAEQLADLLVALAPDYEAVIASTASIAKAALPRAAARLDVMQLSDVIDIDGRQFKRPVYAGNAVETVETSDRLIVMTVRASSFSEAGASVIAAPIEPTADVSHRVQSVLLSRTTNRGARPELSSARVVISGGRAFGSAEQFEALIGPVADRLGAAIGASRAAVDAGYAGNDLQVGQTGKIVAPDVYLACGISGAIQHVAGMKDARIVIAINKDREAPIMKVADYALIGDVFTVLPALAAALDR